jgi:hypothetical protein
LKSTNYTSAEKCSSAELNSIPATNNKLITQQLQIKFKTTIEKGE